MDVKLIVAGGRDFADYDLLESVIRRQAASTFFPEMFNLTIVSGGARGADQLGERFAREYVLDIDRYIPKWRVNGVYNNAAGYQRNELMADNATHLIAFWDGKSKGTKHMINIANRKGLEVQVVRY